MTSSSRLAKLETIIYRTTQSNNNTLTKAFTLVVIKWFIIIHIIIIVVVVLEMQAHIPCQKMIECMSECQTVLSQC